MSDFDKLKKKGTIINAIEKAQNSYAIDSGIMPFIRVVPIIGDMISTTTEKAVSNFQNKKQKELINYILENKEFITSEKVNDIEFIFNFTKTVESVKRLSTNDKIKYFGKLLKNGYFGDEHINNDDFEEYSNIINELSYREINYLCFFKYMNDNKNTYSLSWNKFVRELCKEFNVKTNEVEEIFRRLLRSGFIEELYETESGDVQDDSIDSLPINSDGFMLTNSFDKFYEMITK